MSVPEDVVAFVQACQGCAVEADGADAVVNLLQARKAWWHAREAPAIGH